jgi:ubiquinone/menaquinone biosynthesis C-methylase UbiE
MNAELQKRQAIDVHSEQADLFASRYGNVESNAYQDCFAYSRKRLQHCLERYLPEKGAGARLLDVGCGTGHQVAELRERGFTVAGVDGSPEMLEHARVLNPGADLRLGDVESLPFPDASFDFILCIEVLRYLPDSLPCLREMARVLRPGGRCLVTALPLFNLNGYWLVNRLAHLTHVKGLVPLKQYFVTSWGLRRNFLAAGFRTPTVHGVYFGPVNWVQRLTPRLLPWFLKQWESIDAAVADRPWRDLSNMFLVHAVRQASDEVPHGRT